MGADIWQVLRDSTNFLMPILPAGGVLILGTLFFALLCTEPQGTLRGVKVGGYPVGGLSQDDLQRVVTQRAQTLANTPVTLVFGEGSGATQTLTVKPRDLAVWEKAPLPTAPYTNVPSVVARSYMAGRELSLLDRLHSRWFVNFKPGLDFPLRATLDEDRLKRRLRALKKQPVNAYLVATGDDTLIKKEVPGLEVDPRAALQQITQGLAKGQTAIRVPARVIKPKVVAADLVGLKQQAVSVVPITSPNPNAKINARISAHALRSTTIAPGEVISFNSVLGERTPEKGYKVAVGIENSRDVSAVGAGICYTATAAFQVAKKSEKLAVVERHGHSRRVLYATRDNDATLSWSARKDLKLKNISQKPVVLMMSVNGKHVYARLLSASPQ